MTTVPVVDPSCRIPLGVYRSGAGKPLRTRSPALDDGDLPTNPIEGERP